MAVATPVYNLLGGLRNRILDRGTVRRDELRRMMRAAANGATDLNGSEFLDALSRVRRRVHASITDGEMRLLYRHFAARAGGANVPVEEVLAALDLPETPPPPEGTRCACSRERFMPAARPHAGSAALGPSQTRRCPGNRALAPPPPSTLAARAGGGPEVSVIHRWTPACAGGPSP